MIYKNLKDLIYNSNSSRMFFLSQPVDMQISLHKHGDYIHTASDLHRRVDEITAHERAVKISENKL